MSERWQRRIAIWMLALAAFGASAAACAALCAAEHDLAVSSAMADEASMRAHCPLAQLCDLAVSPVILAATSPGDQMVAAYVKPLAPNPLYERDPDPPQKPPAV